MRVRPPFLVRAPQPPARGRQTPTRARHRRFLPGLPRVLRSCSSTLGSHPRPPSEPAPHPLTPPHPPSARPSARPGTTAHGGKEVDDPSPRRRRRWQSYDGSATHARGRRAATSTIQPPTCGNPNLKLTSVTSRLAPPESSTPAARLSHKSQGIRISAPPLNKYAGGRWSAQRASTSTKPL